MNTYKIIKANDKSNGIQNNRDSIISLWNSNLSNSSFENRFSWLYELNPSGPATTWLAVEDESKKIVGCNSLYPRTIIFKGEKLNMGIAADFAINKEHRVFGPALKMQREITSTSLESGFDFNFAYPNKSSSAVFIRAGYKLMGESESWVKLLHTANKIVKYVRFGLLAKFIGIVVDKFLKLSDSMHNLFSSKNYSFEILEKCDDRFDVLWKEAGPKYKIIGEKTSAYLNWRYSECKTEKFKYFCLIDKENEHLKGFIVYAIKENVATIFDLFSFDMEDILCVMLLKYTTQMRNEKANSIALSFLGTPDFIAAIKKLKFFRRPLKRQCLIYTNDEDKLGIAKEIFEKNNWFLFDGEMDL